MTLSKRVNDDNTVKRNPLAAYLTMRYAALMHVISRKALRVFWLRHPDSERPLVRWFKIMQQTQFSSFTALRRTFPSADKIGELVVFNIAGNKYRLIASVHFNRAKVYIRHVLTHQAYDRGGWMT